MYLTLQQTDAGRCQAYFLGIIYPQVQLTCMFTSTLTQTSKKLIFQASFVLKNGRRIRSFCYEINQRKIFAKLFHQVS